MKKVIVKYLMLNGEEAEGTLIESIDDVKKIRTALKNAEDGVLKKYALSGETPSRINHITNGFRPLEMAIAALSIERGYREEKNPLYFLGESSDTYIGSLTSSLINGPVFINSNGGMTPIMVMNEPYLEIMKAENVEIFEERTKVYMPDNPRVINLENDWEPEEKAIEWMENEYGRGKYAYITELRLITKRHLGFIFDDFVKKGGHTVYVYTTGSNHEQMYEYSEIAMLSGLKKFIFDFNCGMDDDIKKFIKWLSQRANVKLLNKK